MGDQGLGRPAAEPGAHDAHDLGPQLQPALLSACGGCLCDVRWFRTDWQRGGAATGYGRFSENGASRDVVIKLPVGPRELRVLTRLSACAAPTPRVVREGQELGGYDLGWVVMERLPGAPLSAALHHDVFDHLAQAAARFYASAAEVMPLEPAKERYEWPALLERSREALRTNQSVPHAAQWAAAVKQTQHKLPTLLKIWNARAINTWCHGDLHPGNCMERPAGSAWGEAGCVLLDFAEVHPGHWVEDAVYLERICWGRPKVLGDTKPVSLIAQARRAIGLDTSDDYGSLANVRRILMAATTPAFLGTEGHPAYLNAALEMLERLLPGVKT
ncbi:MAG: aminoglycoside phosphotransferase family protein [Planctomycetota bacterium]|nr:aminoglycoside phosphotransferase family protein [Planctomycetota bacterium]